MNARDRLANMQVWSISRSDFDLKTRLDSSPAERFGDASEVAGVTQFNPKDH